MFILLHLQRVVKFEEADALKRSSAADAQLYFDICQNIRKLLTEISELKVKNGPDSKVQEKSVEICLQIVVLKKLNRMEKVRLIFPKEQLANEKQKVDSINLHYQNLLYESNYLGAEYRKCLQFR